MKKSEEIANPNSCFNKAKDDEMLFVLLERDSESLVAVRAWIDERIKSGKNVPTDDKIQSAEQWIITVRQKLITTNILFK